MTDVQNKFLQLHPQDNVAVALQDLTAGTLMVINGNHVTLGENVSAKHKFTLADLNDGDKVVMYGVVVGIAVGLIKKGTTITTRNVKHDASPYLIRKSDYTWSPPDVLPWKNRTFLGYHRSDGQVGTRNHWLIVPLVFCENRNVEYIKSALIKKLGYARPDKYEGLVDNLVSAYQRGARDFKTTAEDPHAEHFEKVFQNIDGIKFLSHQGGCGGTREDSDNLCKLIAGYLNNPNVAGATILSLGCQHAQIEILQKFIAQNNPSFSKPVLYFEQQKFPGEELMLTEAIRQTFAMLVKANEAVRMPAPLSKLCIGLKCGGSDGFSGITANPAMGLVSDMVAALGGKTILAEFPELCGVEQDLIDRCKDIGAAQKFASLMTTYNEKANAIGSGFSMNPSPGNIKDGLITDAMKSAGAAKKGGTSPVNDVLDYGEYVREAGLNLLCTPGNDVEATTGMAGSGTNLIIFSTGLGTPTGNPVAPVVKTATNSILASKLQYLIDYDHGDMITNGKTLKQSASDLLEQLVKIASGEILTKAEVLQQDDFIPWKRGVSL